MEIEKVEKLLSGLNSALEEAGEVSAAAVLPAMQLSLLLHIYKKLESIDDSLISLLNISHEEHYERGK